MAFTQAVSPLAAHLTNRGNVPPWERPLTARQAYWLSCVESAVASVQVETGQAYPVAVSRVIKEDRSRHGGAPSASIAAVVDTLDTLAQRRWLVRGELPIELRSRDRRCSVIGYQLSDRSTLHAESLDKARLQTKLAKLDAVVKRLRGSMGFDARPGDEEMLSGFLKQQQAATEELRALEAAIALRIAEGVQSKPFVLPKPDHVAHLLALAAAPPASASSPYRGEV